MQLLVKVGAPSETRVQLAAEKLPVPTPLRVKSTEPAGSRLVPKAVSVTVAVQVPAWPRANDAGQSINVEVERSATVMVSPPVLVA